MSEAVQLDLFGNEEATPEKEVMKGRNAAFRDYDAFLAKFDKKLPKTTDDCYTPPDVYGAVVDYVATVYSLEGKEIIRPFYPGGDYENTDYPDNGIVIDNPPFSMFMKICRFYMARGVPFFLFAPGMTVFSCVKLGATAVVAGPTVRFTNGALARCNFAGNIFGDLAALTAPALYDAIRACPSQAAQKKGGHKQYRWPEEVLRVSDMQTICQGGVDFSVRRDEAFCVPKLDHLKDTFGDSLLISAAKAEAKAEAKAKAEAAIPIRLSEREERIVSRLGG